MSLLAFLLLALVLLVTAFAVFSLVHLISTDGLAMRRSRAPRSHHPDMFEPHRFA
jgi:hypothetical protein